MKLLQLTVAQRLLGAAAIAVGIVLASGLIGYVQIARLDRGGDEAARAASAIRQQMQADQAHDALRADVLAALVAGARKSADEEKGVLAEVAAHGEAFSKSMAAVLGMHLGADIDQAAATLAPQLEAYRSQVADIAKLAFTDVDAATARMSTLMASFKALEKDMAALSDMIEAHARATRAEGDAIATASRNSMIVATLGASALLLLLGWLNTRHIMGQLGGEPQDVARAANAIAAGDLTTRFDLQRAGDRSIVAAMHHMQESLRDVVTAVRASSYTIAENSSEIAKGNADLSQRT